MRKIGLVQLRGSHIRYLGQCLRYSDMSDLMWEAIANHSHFNAIADTWQSVPVPLWGSLPKVSVLAQCWCARKQACKIVFWARRSSLAPVTESRLQIGKHKQVSHRSINRSTPVQHDLYNQRCALTWLFVDPLTDSPREWDHLGGSCNHHLAQFITSCHHCGNARRETTSPTYLSGRSRTREIPYRLRSLGFSRNRSKLSDYVEYIYSITH